MIRAIDALIVAGNDYITPAQAKEMLSTMQAMGFYIAPIESNAGMFMNGGNTKASNRSARQKPVRVGDMAAVEVWDRMIAAWIGEQKY